MTWRWRALAITLFIIVMVPVVLLAKWIGMAIPEWVAFVVAGAALGVWATLGFLRWEQRRQGRVTIFPPD